MGAQGSANRGGPDAGQGGEAIVDYYKILEVAEDATQDEIKVRKRHLYLSRISNLNLLSYIS